MYPSIGIAEIVVLCISGIIVIGIPSAILITVVMLYKKLQNIEEHLKKE